MEGFFYGFSSGYYCLKIYGFYYYLKWRIRGGRSIFSFLKGINSVSDGSLLSENHSGPCSTLGPCDDTDNSYDFYTYSISIKIFYFFYSFFNSSALSTEYAPFFPFTFLGLLSLVRDLFFRLAPTSMQYLRSSLNCLAKKTNIFSQILSGTQN